MRRDRAEADGLDILGIYRSSAAAGVDPKSWALDPFLPHNAVFKKVGARCGSDGPH